MRTQTPTPLFRERYGKHPETKQTSGPGMAAKKLTTFWYKSYATYAAGENTIPTTWQGKVEAIDSDAALDEVHRQSKSWLCKDLTSIALYDYTKGKPVLDSIVNFRVFKTEGKVETYPQRTADTHVIPFIGKDTIDEYTTAPWLNDYFDDEPFFATLTPKEKQEGE